MSYLFRWVRQNHTLVSKSKALLTNTNSVSPIIETTSVVKPLYQVARLQPISSSNKLYKTTEQGKNGTGASTTKEKKHDDGIEYTITFKRGTRVKDVIKQFYSLYGPVFVACHIAVSLASLGFFCSLVLMSVDLTQYVSLNSWVNMNENVLAATEKGGKFVMAYAIHKLLLPIRLAVSVMLTRTVSRLIKRRRGQT